MVSTQWLERGRPQPRLIPAHFTGTGGTLTADGGVIGIPGSTLTSGRLVAADNPASAVRFSADVTFNGVPWEDPSAGEFQIVNTTARLLGDYLGRR